MNCPLCSNKSTHWFVKNGHTLYRCTSCDLGFVHPIPRVDVYDKDYFEGAHKGFGYVNYDEDKEPMVPAFVEYLRRIERVLGKKGTLLDVGAATGFFVHLASERGFDASGVEISDHAAARAREKGLDVATGTLQDVSGEFDCITMLDVIEHVPDPKQEIARAAKRLRAGGLLVINTPDIGSFFARLLGKRWHLIVPPEHLYYFNRANVTRLLEEQGFSVLEVTTIGKSFTFKYIFKTLYKWTKISVFNWCASLASRYMRHAAFPINLHDNMFLLARKK